MKTNVTKRIVTLVLAFAVVFTTVFAGGTSVEAAENVQTLYISSALENATAGSEIKVPFTATSNKELAITVRHRQQQICKFLFMIVLESWKL